MEEREDSGALAVPGEDLSIGDGEVEPPQSEGCEDACGYEGCGVEGPALAFDKGLHDGDGPEDPFVESDDDQQPVSLGQMVRMQRCGASASFDQCGAGKFDEEQHGREDQGHDDVEVGEGEKRPTGLGGCDGQRLVDGGGL